MIYGTKIILLDDILMEQLFQPSVSKDDNKSLYQKYVFTSSRVSSQKLLGTKMDHSAVANAMAASFRKAKVSFLSKIWNFCVTSKPKNNPLYFFSLCVEKL